MTDKEFVNGMIVKAPYEKAPDFVKADISIKRKELIGWLSNKQGDWININVKESQGGKWYAEVNDWKPNQEQPGPNSQSMGNDDGQGGFEDDDVVF